ncbi:MAG TPA: Snf7 family protein [Ramlibacter sp.]|jgi:hypothetical protein|nr:Snf7 family protein [Ramlibacter sp.]
MEVLVEMLMRVFSTPVPQRKHKHKHGRHGGEAVAVPAQGAAAWLRWLPFCAPRVPVADTAIDDTRAVEEAIRLNTELLGTIERKHSVAMRQAREMKAAGQMQAALLALRDARRLEKAVTDQAEVVDSMRALHLDMSVAENVLETAEALAGMGRRMDRMTKRADTMNIDNVRADIAEAREKWETFTRSVATPIGGTEEITEAELLRDLEALDTRVHIPATPLATPVAGARKQRRVVADYA